ncbi:MAG: ABC transporter ATP-binding protein [Candidatus Helarchaeota archaeon]
MDKDLAIKVEHVSKKYCKSLIRSMWYGIKDITRNTFGRKSNSHKLRKGEFWALDDISFEVKKGETLGVIGPNGSGKTTLLKLLNGIFWPDKGKITLRGRVGALIEVGAGFHPLLTGRQNIYINAAILGMKKKEVDEKFEDIVKFAGIGDFINIPVKYYSSGMFVRLGFAVMAHCNRDILLIDEVLAVGDSAFRVKCQKKMNEIKRKKDVAIVFVSHDLLTVARFCDKGIFINKGKIVSMGEIHDVIRKYQSLIIQLGEKEKKDTNYTLGVPYCTKEVEILKISYLGSDNTEQDQYSINDTLKIRVEYKANKKIINPIFQISILNRNGVHISVLGTHIDGFVIPTIEGIGAVECQIDNLPLLWNSYYVTVAIYDKSHTIPFDYRNEALYQHFFHILPDKISERMADYTPICKLSSKWKVYSNFSENH